MTSLMDAHFWLLPAVGAGIPAGPWDRVVRNERSQAPAAKEAEAIR